ncbi:hypothetical protein Bca4012_046099 [Brassica carinata]
MMESKGGNKKSSSSSSLCYEAPLGYSIEDVRPNGGIKKFKSSVYSNVRHPFYTLAFVIILNNNPLITVLFCFVLCVAVREEAILSTIQFRQSS